MIRQVMTRFTVRSPRHGTRLSLHRAKPALLNAETAWNTPRQSASPGLMTASHRTVRMAAPRPSIASVSLSTVPANRTRPSMSCTFKASCRVRRSCSETDRPSAATNTVLRVM